MGCSGSRFGCCVCAPFREKCPYNEFENFSKPIWTRNVSCTDILCHKSSLFLDMLALLTVWGTQNSWNKILWTHHTENWAATLKTLCFFRDFDKSELKRRNCYNDAIIFYNWFIFLFLTFKKLWVNKTDLLSTEAFGSLETRASQREFIVHT